MHKLVISDDEGKTTVVPLVRDEVTIGRREGNTIRLTERNVSRRHARLLKENGAFVVEDLGSYNGVRLNGRRIETPSPLGPGDQITIGDYHLALQVEAAQQPAPPVTPPAEPAPATEPAPPARLVMLTPPAPGAEFALSRPRVRIGRAEDLDVWVNHRSISREHAEIVQKGEGFTVVDLGSANGVRVNGGDATERGLEPGDVVELGQVRFRFVGPGEHYVFDADSTVQMEPVSAAARPSRMPLVAAILIVGGSVAVGAFIALSGEPSPEPTPTLTRDVASSAPPSGPSEALEPGGDDDPNQHSLMMAVAEATRKCRKALEADRYEEAIVEATKALSHQPEHGDALDCRASAEKWRQAEDFFTRGKQALESGDYEGAWAQFQELPEGGDYLDREEVLRARDGYARAELESARAALGSAPHEARRIAQRVLEIEDLPGDIAGDARRLERLAVVRLRRSAGRLAASKARASRTHRSSSSSSSASSGSPSTETGGSSAGQASENGSTGTKQQATSSGPSPMEQANQCLFSGAGDRCVIRALEGKARSAREIAMLIEAYRGSGQAAKKKRWMGLYLSRFPDGPQARQYERELGN